MDQITRLFKRRSMLVRFLGMSLIVSLSLYLIVLGFIVKSPKSSLMDELATQWKLSGNPKDDREAFNRFLGKYITQKSPPPFAQPQKTPDRAPHSPSGKTLLIGILTVPEKYDRRALIRSTYAQLSSPLAHLRFVFCLPRNAFMETLVLAEKRVYKDIIVLNCTENMDNGKTYSYISALPNLFKNGTFDYVMKTDDDVFLHIPNLVKKIQTFSSTGVFYGRQAASFMAGMGYLMSWDLVYWIATDPFPKSHTEGQEDATLAWWLNESKLIKDWISDEEEFYDEPDSKQGWAHPYTPNTILIHRLKDSNWFLKANRFFMNHLLDNSTLISTEQSL